MKSLQGKPGTRSFWIYGPDANHFRSDRDDAHIYSQQRSVGYWFVPSNWKSSSSSLIGIYGLTVVALEAAVNSTGGELLQ